MKNTNLPLIVSLHAFAPPVLVVYIDIQSERVSLLFIFYFHIQLRTTNSNRMLPFRLALSLSFSCLLLNNKKYICVHKNIMKKKKKEERTFRRWVGVWEGTRFLF